MNRVLILSFMHEHNMIIQEFELLKSHYKKMIQYYNLPMQYYGVRLTERDDVNEYLIDNENEMIWIKSKSIQNEDADLYGKVIKGLRVVEKELDYDVVVKTNTSFLLNLMVLNHHIQNTPNIENNILTSITYECRYPNAGLFNSARGNCMVIHKDLVKYFLEHSYEVDVLENDGCDRHADDQYISYILKDKDCQALGQYSLSQQDDVAPHNSLEYIDDIFNTIGITIKTYDGQYAEHFRYFDKDALMIYCTDTILLRLFINHIEDRYIPKFKPMVTRFTF